MMLDIHSHILPGLDDGPADVHAALIMARQAVKDGVTEMIATPHCFDGVYNCHKMQILERCKQFNQTLKEQNIPLIIHPGAEIRLVPEVIDHLDRGELLTLGDAGRAILLELPHNFIPNAMGRLIREIGRRGVRVVIAHPERNLTIGNNYAVVEELLQSGASMQITGSSLGGRFSWPRKTFADQLVLRGAAHFVASDCHNSKKRSPGLAAAYKRVRSIAGENMVTKMQDEALLLLAGKA